MRRRDVIIRGNCRRRCDRIRNGGPRFQSCRRCRNDHHRDDGRRRKRLWSAADAQRLPSRFCQKLMSKPRALNNSVRDISRPSALISCSEISEKASAGRHGPSACHCIWSGTGSSIFSKTIPTGNEPSGLVFCRYCLFHIRRKMV